MSAPSGLVTVSLTIDFMGVARAGDWVEAVAEPARIGGTLCFSAGWVTANGVKIARTSGTFRVIMKG